MESATRPSKREAYRNAKITPLMTTAQRPPSPWTASHSPRLLSPSTRSTAPSTPQPSARPSLPSVKLETSEREELQRLVHAPPFWKSKRRLSKQLSMCETARDRAWERRRRQDQRRKGGGGGEGLTDEDLHELKGCIELGFGFREEEARAGGQRRLCNTLPALDLYFAVNRQLSSSPVSTPRGGGETSAGSSLGARSASLDSLRRSEDPWRIFGPGDSPQQVKTKLRHWAQAVACSVMQSF